MINYSLAYPGRVDNDDPTYPTGKARNLVATGTGTPADARWVNDMWGSWYALLLAGGLTPDNTPENVSSSQLVTALRAIGAAAAGDVIEGRSVVPYAPGSTNKARLNGVWTDAPTDRQGKVALFGATRVDLGATATWQITNYSAFSSYTVTVPDGFAGSESGGVVSVDVPAAYEGDDFSLLVSRDGSANPFLVDVGAPPFVPDEYFTAPDQSLGQPGVTGPRWNYLGYNHDTGIYLAITTYSGTQYWSVSTDGAAWSPTTPPRTSSGGADAKDSIDGLLWYVCDGTVYGYISQDGGVTWGVMAPTSGTHAIAGNGSNVLALRGNVNSGDARWSTDYGTSWVALPAWLNSGSTRNGRDVCVNDDGSVWLAVYEDGKSAKSTDGTTWVASYDFGVDMKFIDFVDGRLLACSGRGLFYESFDDGDNWVPSGLGQWPGLDTFTTNNAETIRNAGSLTRMLRTGDKRGINYVTGGNGYGLAVTCGPGLDVGNWRACNYQDGAFAVPISSGTVLVQAICKGESAAMVSFETSPFTLYQSLAGA